MAKDWNGSGKSTFITIQKKIGMDLRPAFNEGNALELQCN